MYSKGFSYYTNIVTTKNNYITILLAYYLVIKTFMENFTNASNILVELSITIVYFPLFMYYSLHLTHLDVIP